MKVKYFKWNKDKYLCTTVIKTDIKTLHKMLSCAYLEPCQTKYIKISTYIKWMGLNCILCSSGFFNPTDNILGVFGIFPFS